MKPKTSQENAWGDESDEVVQVSHETAPPAPVEAKPSAEEKAVTTSDAVQKQINARVDEFLRHQKENADEPVTDDELPEEAKECVAKALAMGYGELIKVIEELQIVADELGESSSLRNVKLRRHTRKERKIFNRVRELICAHYFKLQQGSQAPHIDQNELRFQLRNHPRKKQLLDLDRHRLLARVKK